jgi:hypothetical protein
MKIERGIETHTLNDMRNFDIRKLQTMLVKEQAIAINNLILIFYLFVIGPMRSISKSLWK